MIHFLKILVKVYRRRNVGTDFRPIWAWYVLHETKGLIDQLSGNKIIKDEGNQVISDHICYLLESDIEEKDRILCDGDVFEIYRVFNPNKLNRHFEIYLKKLPAGVWEEMDEDSSDI